ncbi:MAG: hypothetical protein JSR48_02900 [Verrucomicrobia bacterium]|nr:hypothetical protein [Verrucomicrobiota bacterium]
MSPSEPAVLPVPPPPRDRRIEFAGYLLLWLACLQPPRTLAPGLDASWQLMLDFAHDHGMRFGTDLLPTMGPAGFLIAPAPAIHHLTARFAWMIFGNAALAGVFWSLGRRLAGLRRGVYYLFLLTLVAPFPEVLHGLAILAVGLTLLREEVHTRVLRATGLAAFLGFLALFKFTHFTLATAVVACAVWAAFRRDGARSVLLLGTGYAAGVLGGWHVLGQPTAQLLPFLRQSVEISRGYVDAMSLAESAPVFWTGLAAIGLSAAYAWSYWRAERDRAVAHAAAGMLAASWFINWKHGFVRADGHVLAHFISCLFPAVAFPALLREAPSAGRRRLTAVLAVVSVAGVWQGYAPALTEALATLNHRVVENLSVLAELRHPRTYARAARAAFAEFGRARVLPRITALAGADSVDVLGAEQSIAMLGSLHYTPRPVFQGYYAYTPALSRLNEGFYASDRGPRFVLQKLQTIDGRVPTLDDARVLAQLFTHYALVAEEHDWLLWERVSRPTALRTAPIATVETSFGSAVPVPASETGALWVRIDARLSLLGRLREFFYKPPPLALRVVDATGAAQSYRLVRAMGADGFILQPYLTSQAAVTGYFTGRDPEPPAAKSLAVELPASDQAYYSARVTVSFERLPALARPPHPGAVPTDPRYRMFSLGPARVASPHPWGPSMLGSREVFFIHAPGEIEFDPDMACTHFHGEVGLSPDAYTATQQSDGVEIIIEHVSPGGRRTVLMRRYLDPVHRPEDRGLQPFSFALPGKGRVILRNLTGPKDNPAFDWTLWADLRFD